MKKRVLALLVAALLLQMVSCGQTVEQNTEIDGTQNTTNVDVSETIETEDPTEKDDLPTDCKDYDGTDFTVMYRDRTTWQTATWWMRWNRSTAS